MRALVVLVLVAGCGRLGFGSTEATTDAALPADTTSVDAPGSDTVFYLPFDDDPGDGTMLDASGHGFDAHCITGLTCPSQAVGKRGTAVRFNGTSQYALIPHQPGLDLTTYTLAAWVYLEVANVDQVAVGREVGAGSNDSLAFVAWNGTMTCFETTIAGDVKQDVCSTAVLGVNTWYHLASTFDGAEKTLYINGAKAAAKAGAAANAFDTHDLVIGADQNGGMPAYSWHGRIDELRMYDHALTPAQVMALAAP